jgi:2-oxoglutarate ferredoxin oxidoreductase subunit delta
MIYVDAELCKSCKICMNVCPKEVFAITNKVNKKGYNYVEAVKPDECITCKKCERSCPDFAIFVEK